MDPPPRRMIACTSCARLKTKCDKKLPCGRCVARNVTCDPRQVRRWTNVDSSSNATRTATQASKSERHRPATPQNNVAQDEIVDATVSWGSGNATKSRARSITDDPSRGLSESLLLFDFDPFQNDLSTSRDNPRGLNLASNGLQQSDATSMCFNGSTMIPATLATNGEDVMMTDKFPGMASAYTYDNLDFEMPILSDEQFLQLPYNEPFFQPQARTSNPEPQTQQNTLSTNNGGKDVSGVPQSMDTQGSSVNAELANKDKLSKSHGSIQDHDSVRVSRKHWSSFNCLPSEMHAKCPRTAEIYLEGLVQALSSQDMHYKYPLNQDAASPNDSIESPLAVVAIDNYTRDKLLICTQTLLQKVLQSHRDHPSMRARDTATTFHHLRGSNDAFIVLPATAVLDTYIRTYASRFEQSYPLTPGGELEINSIMQTNDPRAPALFMLLMIALGSMNHKHHHVPYLVSGLTEVCRIGVLEALESNRDTNWDLCSLRSAMLFTLLAAWSGDKWHMDAAIAQRGMNASLLRQAKLLTHCKLDLVTLGHQNNEQTCWEAWKIHEARNRLLYSWVNVDLEISVFHSVAPVFSVNELCAVLPQHDSLWQARTASEWNAIRNQASHASSNLSLSELFGTYVQNGSPESLQLTHFQLHLLLYPIQSLVYNVSQFRSCGLFTGQTRTLPRPSNKSRVGSRLGEAQILLSQWYHLHRLHVERTAKEGQQSTSITISLILYHLISLDASVCFRCIEQLGHSALPRRSWGQHVHCIEDAEETWIHCGQILRLLRRIPETLRLAWYPAAVYRVALISHANSVFLTDSALHTPTNGYRTPPTSANGVGDSTQIPFRNDESASVFAIDTLLPEDSRLEQYQKYGEGIPMLRRRSGTFIRTTDAPGVLKEFVNDLNTEQVKISPERATGCKMIMLKGNEVAVGFGAETA